MAALYNADDRDLLTSVFAGDGVHLEPAAILDGLTDDQARARPHGLPRSIAEIVAHMCYWQEWFNGCVATGFTGIARHSVDAWPAVSADGWDALRDRFIRSIEEAKRIAAGTNPLAAPLLPSDANVASLARESRGSGLLRAAIHNSHHLGQIVTMRRLMELWPPPGGTIEW